MDPPMHDVFSLSRVLLRKVIFELSVRKREQTSISAFSPPRERNSPLRNEEKL